MTRTRIYTLLIAVCALPRLGLLLHERGGITANNFEKSNLLAQMYLKSGTFGYVPGHPSAYTQPLYGWFLIGVFWIGGFNWWSVGTAQIVVAVTTSLAVFEIGRRFCSPRVGVLAALIATLQPYLVWHDIHGNREILDQLLGTGLFGLTLLVATRPVRDRTGSVAVAALGVVSGLAILSNTRLLALPFVLAAFLLWRKTGWLPAAAVLVLTALVLAPWVVRNKVEVGCFAITTDARALWKANNASTYSILSHGGWIDQVPDIPERTVMPRPTRWDNPEEAGRNYLAHGTIEDIPECAQQAHYEHLVLQFWFHHPFEKAKLAAQATWMMWNPRVGIENAQESGVDNLRRWAEPLYTVPLFLLAIAGLFVVAPAFRALAVAFVAYETLASWVFAGTTRYRVPWDFVLALLAAATLERLISATARRRGPGRTSATAAP